MKRSLLMLGNVVFYGDYKNRLSLKEYMKLAGDYTSYFLKNFTVLLL